MAKAKTEDKPKTEAAVKREFIEKCYEAVCKEILKNTRELRKTNQIQIIIKNYNRYINFLKYGQKMCIALFTSGDIDIKVGEFCHSDYKERIFEYDPDPAVQEEFLKRFKGILKWLVPAAIGEGFDMHVFMDYISWNKGGLERCYEDMVKDHLA